MEASTGGGSTTTGGPTATAATVPHHVVVMHTLYGRLFVCSFVCSFLLPSRRYCKFLTVKARDGLCG
jgi:hypothetical protein